MTSHPRITIITPSFNQAAWLEQTMRSVLDQGYPNLDYLVIDGGSRDGSPEIIARYADRLSWWESEPDRGQVHAINKGLARARGEIFAFLNSDDLYLPGALAAVADYFAAHPGCDWLCGDTIFFGAGHPTRLFEAIVPTSPGQALSWAAHAPQPGMFWRRRVLTGEIGGFDERWNYCFDHEFYVRLLLAGYRCAHLSLPLAAYRLHAESKTVSSADSFDREFDEIALQYEPRLAGRERRWTKSTRLFRASYSASTNGEVRVASRLLLDALRTYPESLFTRLFWGCLRRFLTSLQGGKPA
ncbi:MAG: glycosyltransferase family 2 protein [Blastocatellia bacterium]|nr:glycosyltransferase family 2 protein [Blastocatellia bacterium]